MLTVKDLMQRYNITRQGVRRFVDKHIDEINSDGIEHAKPTADGWQFDAEAVRTIDELRGLSQVAIIENSESETVTELKNEIEDLKQILLMTQSKLIKAQEDLTENQKLLLESEKNFLAIESKSNNFQAELKLERELHSVTKQKLEDTKSQFEIQIEKIKSRGLLDRILNNV